MNKRFLTAIEIAEILGVSIDWVRSHSLPSCRNRLPVVKIGGLVRFELDQILKWIRDANSTQKGAL